MRKSCGSSMYWWSSVGERAGGLAVVAERLLDDDPRVLRDAGLRQPLDDPAEEERRDLEVEDRALGAGDRGRDALVRGGVAEVALDVRETLREAREHRLVELLAGADDRVAGALDELVDRPVVDGDADDRALEQPTLLEPVERMERHDLGQVPGDPEDHEDVGLLRLRRRRRRGGHCCARHLVPPPLAVPRHGSLRHAAATPVICSRSPRTRSDPAHALVGEPRAGPVDDRLRPILVRRQEREVHGAPGDLGLQALHRPPTEHLRRRRRRVRSSPSSPCPCT